MKVKLKFRKEVPALALIPLTQDESVKEVNQAAAKMLRHLNLFGIKAKINYEGRDNCYWVGVEKMDGRNSMSYCVCAVAVLPSAGAVNKVTGYEVFCDNESLGLYAYLEGAFSRIIESYVVNRLNNIRREYSDKRIR